MSATRPDFEKLMARQRHFQQTDRKIFGHVPTIAITPVADGRAGAYESNLEGTWKMVERVYDLISKNVFLPDGTSVRIVVAPEIVYGARSGARCEADPGR